MLYLQEQHHWTTSTSSTHSRIPAARDQQALNIKCCCFRMIQQYTWLTCTSWPLIALHFASPLTHWVLYHKWMTLFSFSFVFYPSFFLNNCMQIRGIHSPYSVHANAINKNTVRENTMHKWSLKNIWSTHRVTRKWEERKIIEETYLRLRRYNFKYI